MRWAPSSRVSAATTCAVACRNRWSVARAFKTPRSAAARECATRGRRGRGSAPLEVWVVADELYAIVVAVGLEQPEATDHLLAGDVRSVRHPHRTALCANHAALAFLQLLARNQLALAAQALAPLDVATDARL